eukprot:COSAG01_NODE_2949_length_6803_cov_11.790784_1_plen_45_part_10
MEWKFLRVAEGADEAQRHAAVVREQRDHAAARLQARWRGARARSP